MDFYVASTGGNSPGQVWIAAEGNITDNTAFKFERFMIDTYGERPHYKDFPIVFNSGGGNLLEGLRLGKKIREWRMTTSVGRTFKEDYFYYIDPGICASACAYAFLGGVTRLIDYNGMYDGSKLGLHQFYDNKSGGDIHGEVYSQYDLSQYQMTVSCLVDYVKSMGIDPSFVSLASMTPPDKMYWIFEEEAKDLGINNIGKHASSWELTPKGGLLIGVNREEISKHGDMKTSTVFMAETGPSLSVTQTFVDDISENIKQDFEKIEHFAIRGDDYSTAIYLSRDIVFEATPHSITLTLTLSKEILGLISRTKDFISISPDLPGWYSIFFTTISIYNLNEILPFIVQNDKNTSLDQCFGCQGGLYFKIRNIIKNIF